MIRTDWEGTLFQQILWAKLPEPEREFRIPPRRYRWDFAWPGYGLLVEVQGGVFGGKSGHNTGVGILRDMEKLNYATCNGWYCLKVSGDHIKKGMALEWIKTALYYSPELGCSRYHGNPAP